MHPLPRWLRILSLTARLTLIAWIVTTPPLIYLDRYVARWTAEREEKACRLTDRLNAAAEVLQRKPELVGKPITPQDLVNAGLLEEKDLQEYNIGRISYSTKLPPAGKAYAWWVYDGFDGHHEYP